MADTPLGMAFCAGRRDADEVTDGDITPRREPSAGPVSGVARAEKSEANSVSGGANNDEKIGDNNDRGFFDTFRLWIDETWADITDERNKDSSVAAADHEGDAREVETSTGPKPVGDGHVASTHGTAEDCIVSEAAFAPVNDDVSVNLGFGESTAGLLQSTPGQTDALAATSMALTSSAGVAPQSTAAIGAVADGSSSIRAETVRHLNEVVDDILTFLGSPLRRKSRRPPEVSAVVELGSASKSGAAGAIDGGETNNAASSAALREKLIQCAKDGDWHVKKPQTSLEYTAFHKAKDALRNGDAFMLHLQPVHVRMRTAYQQASGAVKAVRFTGYKSQLLELVRLSDLVFNNECNRKFTMGAPEVVIEASEVVHSMRGRFQWRDLLTSDGRHRRQLLLTRYHAVAQRLRWLITLKDTPRYIRVHLVVPTGTKVDAQAISAAKAADKIKKEDRSRSSSTTNKGNAVSPKIARTVSAAWPSVDVGKEIPSAPASPRPMTPGGAGTGATTSTAATFTPVHNNVGKSVGGAAKKSSRRLTQVMP